MAIFITDADALDKIALIEGDRWRKLQEQVKDSQTSHQSFYTFLKHWLEFKDAAIESGYTPGRYTIAPNGDGAIYGEGGYNRYFVLETGELCFSRFQARRKADLEKAEELGFIIW